MNNSISIRLVVGTPDGASFNTGRNDGSQGTSLAQVQFISLEIGDIDFQPGGGPLQNVQREKTQHGGSNGLGFNSLQAGDIDYRPPGGGSSFSAQKPGQRDASGTPDDILNDIAQFISFLSRLFANQKQDDGNPIEKSDSVSPSKRSSVPRDDGLNTDAPPPPERKSVNNDADLNKDAPPPPKRKSVDNDNDLNTEAPPPPKRKRVDNDDDRNTETPPPPKSEKVGSDGNAKPSSPTTNDNTSVSSSSAAGPVLPPNTGVVNVNEPIIVGPNEVFDGKNKLFKAGPGLNGGGTAETQDPVFILGPGAQLKNVQFEGGDGVHLLGDAKLDNVHAVHGGPDDMITIDGPGNKQRDAKLAGIPLSEIPNRPANVEIQNSSFRHSHDKAIQVNGDANIKLKGIYAEDVGQLLVTLGGQPITAHVSIEDSNIKDLRSHLFRLDSHNSTLDIAPDVKTDNGVIQVMMGDPGNASGATRVAPSTSRA